MKKIQNKREAFEKVNRVISTDLNNIRNLQKVLEAMSWALDILSDDEDNDEIWSAWLNLYEGICEDLPFEKTVYMLKNLVRTACENVSDDKAAAIKGVFDEETLNIMDSFLKGSDDEDEVFEDGNAQLELNAIGKNLDEIDRKFGGKSLNELLWTLFLDELSIFDFDTELTKRFDFKEIMSTDFHKFSSALEKASKEYFDAMKNDTITGTEVCLIEWDGHFVAVEGGCELENINDAHNCMWPCCGEYFAKCDTVEEALERLNHACGSIKDLSCPDLRAAILFKNFENRLNELGVKIR